MLRRIYRYLHEFIGIMRSIITDALAQNKTRPAAKIWLEYKGTPILGSGGAATLKAIKEEKSVSKATKNWGCHIVIFGTIWTELKKVLGKPVVETFKSGKAAEAGLNLPR
jgi:molybdenum-dependent DNA-binding transcriptional regulator ModE